MTEPTRWSSLSEPLRGAMYVVGLGAMVCAVGAAIAAALVWLLT